MSKNEKKEKTSCFVATIDLALAEKLKNDLIQFDFELSKPQYTLFSGKKKGVSISLYESGKLMVQGKEMGEFIEFYLEPEILKSFKFSNPEEYVDLNAHIGCDEAGKGDFFGPLCVAGVYGSTEDIKALLKMGIRDTKKMSDQKTLDLAKKIKKDYAHHILKISPEKYNELYGKFTNLNSLLAWGHATVVEQLSTKTSCNHVIIDKFASDSLISGAVLRKSKNVELTLRTHAEEDILVAAAAVLARSTFLNNLKELGEIYGVELPKGASQKTQEIARALVKKFGVECLDIVCKKHFQTYQQVIDAC